MPTTGLDRTTDLVLRALSGDIAAITAVSGNSTMDWEHIAPRVLRRRPDAASALRALRNGDPAPNTTPAVEAQDDDGVHLVRADSVRPRAVRWLWPGRIPLGVPALLVGEPGLGKTQLAILIAARTTRGTLSGEPADVLIASGEDSPEFVLLPRLLAVDADLTRVHFVQVRRDGLTAELTLPGDVEELVARAEEVQARLIIIDPVMAHLGAAVDAHRDHSIRRALGPVYRAAERLDAAVLGVAHLNKGESANIFKRTGSSIGLTAAARTILLMTRDPENEADDSARVLVHAKANLSAYAPTMRLKVEGCEVADEAGRVIATSRVVLGEEAAHLRTADVLASQTDDGEKRSALEEACDYLRHELANGRREPKPLIAEAKAAGIPEKTLRRAKRNLNVKSDRDGFGPGSKLYWRLPSIDGHAPRPPMPGADVATYGENATPQQQSADSRTIGGHAPELTLYGQNEAADLLTEGQP